MNIAMSPGGDPLGLRGLPEPRPAEGRCDEDWRAVRQALEQGRARRRKAWLAGALGAAAALVVAIGLLDAPAPNGETTLGEQIAAVEPDAADGLQLAELVSLSQNMEGRLRFLRNQVGAMPSDRVVYLVELQDLISQVDDVLSLSPGSAELWGQRVSLQLDLMKLYQDQLRRDHARMASL